MLFRRLRHYFDAVSYHAAQVRRKRHCAPDAAACFFFFSLLLMPRRHAAALMIRHGYAFSFIIDDISCAYADAYDAAPPFSLPSPIATPLSLILRCCRLRHLPLPHMAGGISVSPPLFRYAALYATRGLPPFTLSICCHEPYAAADDVYFLATPPCRCACLRTPPC